MLAAKPAKFEYCFTLLFDFHGYFEPCFFAFYKIMGSNGSKGSLSNMSGGNTTVNFVNSSGEIESSSQVTKKQQLKESDVFATFTWNYGGNQVLLTGSFYKWKQTIPLQKQGDQFVITIQLPRGLHQYKFIVDGEWRFSPEDPIIPDANGNINNFIDTTNFQKMIETKTKTKPGKDDYTDRENTKGVEELAKTAPRLPSHYETCSFLKSFNYNPHMSFPNGGLQHTRMQDENQNFEQSLTQTQISKLFSSPHCLPPPYHVQVGHLIRQINKSYSSYCITQRFKNKYTTYKYYLTGREGAV